MECPSLLTLWRAAQGEYQRALQFHLEKDRCHRCGVIMDSIRAGQTLSEVVVQSFKRWAPAGSFADKKPSLLYLTSQNADRSLTINLQETAGPGAHELIAEVVAPKGNVGRKVEILLVCGERSLADTVTLEDAGEYGSRARCSFGPWRNWD